MTYEPFKCPDCGTWWRTDTHRCSNTPPNKGLSPTPPPKPKYPPTKIDVDHLDLCVVCEKVYDLRSSHHCNKSIHKDIYKDKKQFGKKGNPHEHPVYKPWIN